MRFLPYFPPVVDMYQPVQPMHTRQSRNTGYSVDLIWPCAVSSDVIPFIQAAMIRYRKDFAWKKEHC